MEEIKCPCGLRNYMEEEDCKKTSCNDCCPLTKPQTNEDRIHSARGRELAKILYSIDGVAYCKELPECWRMLEEPGGIPEERCIGCLGEWLKKPVKEDNK